MTRPSARHELAWVLAFSLAALGLVGTFVHQHLASLERGNRLYRDGRVERAEEIYRARAEPELAPGTAVYNLGTALLALGAPEAERYLLVATEGGDSAAAQRGYYNLGYRFLTRFGEVAAPDSAIQLLAAAVGSSRAALRLDPRDQDARWNLALAQSMLDSLIRVVEPEEAASSEEEETDRSEGGIVIPEVARLGAPRGREREALAGDDPGSLNEAEARALLDVVSTDAEQLIRGILWSHRPRVDPWAEPYPGGNW